MKHAPKGEALRAASRARISMDARCAAAQLERCIFARVACADVLTTIVPMGDTRVIIIAPATNNSACRPLSRKPARPLAIRPITARRVGRRASRRDGLSKAGHAHDDADGQFLEARQASFFLIATIWPGSASASQKLITTPQATMRVEMPLTFALQN